MKSKCVCRVAHWCSNPDLPLIDENESEIDSTFLINWLREENVAGIVMADIVNPHIDIDSKIGKILEYYHTQNMALCMVEDGNKNLVGLVGVSNRSDNTKFFDRRLITTISRFVSQDVTKRIHDITLFQVQNRDVLTGLYNRSAYDKKITAMNEAPPQKLGVISANINGLKNINSSLGNVAGDNHIKKSGLAIKSHFGFEIFRVSGDEFVGLTQDMEKEAFDSLVSSLQLKMREENNFDFAMGSSWGEGKYNYVNLLREADSVMYINKQEYYATGKQTLTSVSSVILRDLLSYLENDEFMIYLQPQVRLEDGSLHGAEALIRRFDKKNQKMVFPDQFIPMYEQASVIRHVDLFVVETVCKLLAKWSKENKSIWLSLSFRPIIK